MLKNKLIYILMLSVCSIGNYSYAAEEPREEKSKSRFNQLLLTNLPSDILQEIISFLINTNATTINEYFQDLDNLRLVSKDAKKK